MMLSFFRFDVAREAFERHLLNLNRRPLTIEVGDVVPSVAVVVLNFDLAWLFVIVDFIWRQIDFQLDVILTLANFRLRQ